MRTQVCRQANYFVRMLHKCTSETGSREEIEDYTITDTTVKHNQIGKQETSHYITEKRMSHIDRTRSGETALSKDNLN